MPQFENVVIGKLLSEPWEFISSSKEEYENHDKQYTLFTNERFLPAIMVAAGIVSSRGEVRRNKPELCITLNDDDPGGRWIKWGKHHLWVVVGFDDDTYNKKIKELNELDRAEEKLE